jgi:hypothetical protein
MAVILYSLFLSPFLEGEIERGCDFKMNAKNAPHLIPPL